MVDKKLWKQYPGHKKLERLPDVEKFKELAKLKM